MPPVVSKIKLCPRLDDGEFFIKLLCLARWAGTKRERVEAMHVCSRLKDQRVINYTDKKQLHMHSVPLSLTGLVPIYLPVSNIANVTVADTPPSLMIHRICTSSESFVHLIEHLACARM